MRTEPVKDDDPTIGRLVHNISTDMSALMRKEIALAKSEIQFSVKNAGAGAGFFAGAAFIGLLAIIMLSVAFAYLIHWNGSGLSLHWAFLIVFGVYTLIAALLAYLGYRKVLKVKAPERAIAQAKKTQATLIRR
ncbi:MAG: phage holin family protein [Nocardioides sp.]|jgi:hypothetical protein